jgi:hypothetical protein
VGFVVDKGCRLLPGFDPRVVHVGVVADKVTLDNFILIHYGLPLPNVIPQILHTHLCKTQRIDRCESPYEQRKTKRKFYVWKTAIITAVETASSNSLNSTLLFYVIFFQMTRQPPGGLGRLIIDASRSHVLDTPHSVGLLWTRDQPVAQTST